MKTYLSLLLLCCLSAALRAQKNTKFDPKQTISADSARHSITELMTEMAKKHPGFYRYTSKTEFGRFIDSSVTAIDHPLDQLEYFRVLKPIIARIRCVHTNLSLSESYTDYLNKDANMLPLDLHVEGDKAYIIKNYSGDPSIPAGAELLSINGKPVASIKAHLFSMISSDGFNETWKYQALNHRFSQVYRNSYEVAHAFTISVATTSGPKEWILPAVKNSVIPYPAAMEMSKQPRLAFTIKDSIAVLTIHSFGESDIKAGGQQFRKFIAGAFKELKENNISKLIIDLRDNTGGSDPNAVLLCQFLIDQPFRYWDRIEVTGPFATSLSGSARLFYGKPLKKDSVYLWQRSKFTREFDFYQQQQPQPDVYPGRLVLLVNGACLSSCADVAAVLHYNKRGKLIGEETGGAYQGNNSGLIPEAKLSFGITVSIPLMKYINAVDQSKNFGHGTYPDINYHPAISDLIAGQDDELIFAVNQLEKPF